MSSIHGFLSTVSMTTSCHSHQHIHFSIKSIPNFCQTGQHNTSIPVNLSSMDDLLSVMSIDGSLTMASIWSTWSYLCQFCHYMDFCQSYECKVNPTRIHGFQSMPSQYRFLLTSSINVFLSISSIQSFLSMLSMRGIMVEIITMRISINLVNMYKVFSQFRQCKFSVNLVNTRISVNLANTRIPVIIVKTVSSGQNHQHVDGYICQYCQQSKSFCHRCHL